MKQTGTKTLGSFFPIWLSQLFSITCSAMSSFALSIWLYEKTNSTIAMGFSQACFFVPYLLCSPIAGVIIDRIKKKYSLIISDSICATATIAILVLLLLDSLEPWMVIFASFIFGIGSSFQWPAFSAAIITMVDKNRLDKANGLMTILGTGPSMVAPVAAGVLQKEIGIINILALDIVTFALAVIVVLACMTIEKSSSRSESIFSIKQIKSELSLGWKIIRMNDSFLGMLVYFALINLFIFAITPLVIPFFLESSKNSEITGIMQTIEALGGLASGILLGILPSPKKRMNYIFVSLIVTGLFLGVLFSISNSLIVMGILMLVGSMGLPVASTYSQSIWQSKVDVEVQGRVFGYRNFIGSIMMPIAPMLSGALAELIAKNMSIFIGKNAIPNHTNMELAIRACFLLFGVLIVITSIVYMMKKNVALIEDILPDKVESPVSSI